MTYARDDFCDDSDTLPRMPAWITSGRAETLENVAFLSGAALSHLHLVVRHKDVPQGLLRARLALRAAEVCVGFYGRVERAGELRDALCLLRTEDQPGPSGEIGLHWQRAVERPVTVNGLQRALPAQTGEQIADWLDAGPRGRCCTPVARAAAVIETVLADNPRAESAALILADGALAQALGWRHVVPLLAAGLKRADLRKREDALRLACHRAIRASAVEAAGLAQDLGRRAAHLRAVQHKLRAKGAGAAVEMFLSRDAVAPSALPLPDRSARRLCDRLVELGAVRELTGRDTFRLYGV